MSSSQTRDPVLDTVRLHGAGECGVLYLSEGESGLMYPIMVGVCKDRKYLQLVIQLGWMG